MRNRFLIALILCVNFFCVSPAVGVLQVDQEVKETYLPLPSRAAAFNYVRILVLDAAKEVNVATPAGYRIYDDGGRLLFRGKRLVPTEIQAQPDGMRLGARILKTRSIVIVSEASGVKLGQRTYRYAVEIGRGDGDRLQVVNELPIEDYLKGVLPREVNPEWPVESLKAQAVASRTYALFRAIEKSAELYDLPADVSGQVYGGRTAEDPRTSQAVDMTRGQILVYQNGVFPAFFHSTCGGTLTAAHEVWNVKMNPVLMGGKCPYCVGSKHYFWKDTFTRFEIEKKLKNYGYQVANIRDIKIDQTDASGRARVFAVTQPGGEVKILANHLRMALDPFRFKSALISSMKWTGDALWVQGRGWGHGVGLCQYGMKKLSEIGFDYRKILQYYYPGSKVIKYF